jgi:hypothetical protein
MENFKTSLGLQLIHMPKTKKYILSESQQREIEKMKEIGYGSDMIAKIGDDSEMR